MFALLALILHIFPLTHGFNIRNIRESKPITNNQTDTGFGYSVAFHENEAGKWLLVGAPKYSHTDNAASLRDGAFYKCSLEELDGTSEIMNDCTRIVTPSTEIKGPSSMLLSNNFEGTTFEQLQYDDFDWEPHKGPTSSDQTGPSFDHTIQKISNGTYMLLETSHPRTVGETAMITTPVMPQANAACVRFWYHMRGSSMGSLNVYKFTNATGSRMIWSLEHDQGDKWHEGWVTVVPQNQYQIIFEGVVGQDYNSDIGLDDVMILDGACAEENQPGNGSLGMTLEVDNKSGQILACAPTWMYTCKGQNHATGLCYLFDQDISPDDYQTLSPCRSSSCIDGQMDLVFLIDGSDSVNVLDFRKMLRWLSNVISSLTIGEDMTRVGLAQYSSRPRTEFHLNMHFKLEDLRKAVKKIKYMRETTATGRAIDFISEEMFTERRGMRPNAKYVAVVITDGKSQDDVVPPSQRAKARGITLFAIGIGIAVESELKNISSDPDEQFVYSVNSYKALDGIRGQFQRKLFSLESQGSTFTTEQCQSGISADFLDGRPVIGLPGLQSWDGGFAFYPERTSPPAKSNLLELMKNHTFSYVTEMYENGTVSINSEIGRTGTTASPTSTLTARYFPVERNSTTQMFGVQMSKSQKGMESDDLIRKKVARSYFGYSMSHGSHSHSSSMEIAIGAPRFESKGAVFLIDIDEDNATNLMLVKTFYGGQMGSYFGYATCMTDMNNDGLDEVIIGAPLFLGRYEDIGQVEIYISGYEMLTDSSSRKLSLFGLSERNSRFGFSIAAAGDLNNDGFGDVVIGAPSISDGDGAIFIYNGRKDLELLKDPSQVLRSSKLKSQPVYFGFSLHAGFDADGNGYPDIASGAPGSDNAYVMFSRPVIHVDAQLKSFPSTVNISRPSCFMPHKSESSTIPQICTTVHVCFQVTGKNIPRIVALRFNLFADVGRKEELVRAYFDDYKNEIGVIHGVDDASCSTVTLIFKEPVYDVSTDIKIGMEYNLSDIIQYSNDSALLNAHDKNPVYTKVHLTRNCQNENCETDLKINCSMSDVEDKNGSQSLTLKDDKIISLNVDLTNLADDSYYVKIMVNYSNGLHFSHLRQTSNCVSIERVESDFHFSTNQSDNGGLHRKAENKSSKELWLKYANPVFSQGEPCRFTVQFGVANQSAFYESSLKISVEARSSVADLNSEDNLWEVDLPLYFKGRVILKGVVEGPQVPFSRTELEPKSLRDIGPNVSVTYFVENYGFMEIPSSTIMISWPNATMDGHAILYLTEVECMPLEKCLCNNVESIINPLHLDENVYSSGDDLKDMSGRNETNATSVDDRSEIWINCKKGDVHCESITCHLADVNPLDMIKVILNFSIWEQSLSQMDTWKAHISANAEFMSTYSPFVSLDPKIPEQQVTITTYDSTGQPNPDDSIAGASIKIWVIVLAVVAGIIILALLMLAFYKAGFFKSKYRQKKEETLEWRDFHQMPAAYEGRVHVEAKAEEDTGEHRMTTFQKR